MAINKKNRTDREMPAIVPVTPRAPEIHPNRSPMAKARNARPTYPGMWNLPRAAAKEITTMIAKQAKAKGNTTDSFPPNATRHSSEINGVSVFASTIVEGADSRSFRFADYAFAACGGEKSYSTRTAFLIGEPPVSDE